MTLIDLLSKYFCKYKGARIMKESYKNLTMEIIEFQCEDVITSSGGGDNWTEEIE